LAVDHVLIATNGHNNRSYLAAGCKREFCPTHYDDWVRVIFCTTLFPHHPSRSNGSKSVTKNVHSSENNTITITIE
jgi:hypothetical protein